MVLEIKKEIEEEVRIEVTEVFERNLRDALVGMRDEIESEIREELGSDPDVGGAKSVLSAIADMVAVYRGDPDESAAKDAIRAAELKVSEAEQERDEAISVGKTAAHRLYVEREIGKHPMAKSIRGHFDKRDFESLDDVRGALKIFLSELPDAEDIVTKEEVGFREENLKLKGNITLLEGKVEKLKDKVQKAVKLGERIEQQRISEAEEAGEAILNLKEKVREFASKEEAFEDLIEAKEFEIYKRDKVAGFTNGRELLGLMESVHDRAGVDDTVGEKGLRVVSDPGLQRMRESLGKGKTGSGMRIEEEQVDRGNAVAQVDELGNDMSKLAALAGIHKN